MLPPFLRRPGRGATSRKREREQGVTLALVALAMFTIIAMAGLSIDVGTLYEARAEAQRSADAGALAAARTISLSGITGDPANSSGGWSSVCTLATTIAQTVAEQNTVGGSAPTAVVTYSSDCTAPNATFGINPQVTVVVNQPNLPAYFSRIWGKSGHSVSATATAEVFNPSNSGSITSTGNLVPVQARCVKPWIVPNLDPDNSPNAFVNLATGKILHEGISVNGSGAGVIGETFRLSPDCNSGASGTACAMTTNPPAVLLAPPRLQYLPAQVTGAPVGVPACANALAYQQAIGGCDQTTVYQCGVLKGSAATPTEVDLTENPNTPTSDTSVAAQCLIHDAIGPDTLDATAYPFQIHAGPGNPLNINGTVITNSDSIVSLPIYDGNPIVPTGTTAPVTIVGFLQVFIDSVQPTPGILRVTVLNVAGCGNAVSASATAIAGTSPIAVRLITP